LSERLPLVDLLAEIRQCQRCADLPLGPRPVLRAAASARILIVGQAPGTKVHNTGIPWNDASGERLRQWMGIERETFYDEKRIAIVPMGFCYPGRGNGGDLPPRKECAPHWHPKVLAHLPNIKLILLIGQYAQRHYLENAFTTVSDTVRRGGGTPARYFPLVHPSPRNTRWLKSNPWFEAEIIPRLQARVAAVLSQVD
jgi:uracil-DNA glycosylase family 4